MINIFLILCIIGSPRTKYNKAKRISNPLEAIEYFRQIINDYPETSYADSSLFRIGMFYYLIGDYEQSKNTLEVIYNKGKQSSLFEKSSFWLKYCYQNSGDTIKALEFEKILDSLEKENFSLDIQAGTGKTDRKENNYYTIQLGAYRDEEWAELFQDRLEAKNIKSIWIKNGEYIKICSGKFKEEEDAKEWLEELRDKGFDGFIIEFNTTP